MFLEDLTNLHGVSGDEDIIRDYIKSNIKDYVDDIRVDTTGNLVVFKKGKSSKYKLMISAHMDEVGFIVTKINEDGTIKFKSVGGFDSRILPGKAVEIGEQKVPGIIGIVPIHLQSVSDRKRNITLKELYVDIGASGAEQAKESVSLGDYISFLSKYTELKDDMIKAKAFDDRVGCSVIMEFLKEKNIQLEFDLFACFTVQEEIGLRGSEVTSYTINPDIAIVVEGTTCSDVPGVKEHNYSTKMGKGAVLSIIDNASYSDKEMVNQISKVAEQENIKYQYKETATGGNDAGKIQRTRNGVKTAVISAPVRYIHSPVSVMSKGDYREVYKLVKKFFEGLNEEKILEIMQGGANKC